MNTQVMGNLALQPVEAKRQNIKNRYLESLTLIERLDAEAWETCDRLLADSPALSRETLTAALTEGLAWIHADRD